MAADLFDTYFPFDAGPGAVVAEARWTEAFRTLANTGVVAGAGGELAVTALAALTVRVAAGAAWMEGHYAGNAGVVDHTLATAHATLPRIDRVVVRVDWTANTISTDVLTGAAGASPAVPALTQSSTVWEIPLARIAVAAGQTNLVAGNITDERTLVTDNVPPLEPTPIKAVAPDYEVIYSDRYKVVTMASAGAIFVPTAANVPFAVGDQFTVIQMGAGQLFVTPRTGVTIAGATSAPIACRARYSAVTMLKIATDTWLALGDLA